MPGKLDDQAAGGAKGSCIGLTRFSLSCIGCSLRNADLIRTLTVGR